jgi:hypothetical protein
VPKIFKEIATWAIRGLKWGTRLRLPIVSQQELAIYPIKCRGKLNQFYIQH